MLDKALFDSWYQSDLGRLFHQAEESKLTPLLAQLFGYHLLWIRPQCKENLSNKSHINHQIFLSSSATENIPLSTIAASADDLPIRADSVDLVVMMHSLEFYEDPHAVLREIYRVLIPHGHLLISGFNPWSLWGLVKSLMRSKNPPWCGNFISQARLLDWLKLLEFDILCEDNFFYRPPINHRRFLQKLDFLEQYGEKIPFCGSAGYYLLAQKSVSTLTPIKPRWQPKREVIAKGLAEPSARGAAESRNINE